MHPEFDCDVLIVGSGPAGVSAAFPLVEAGARVLMIDAGTGVPSAIPIGPYLAERVHGHSQWHWMIGADHYALKMSGAVSPKLRVPAHGYVFEQFADLNRIVVQDNYTALGSVSTGGLSNAWGCGVARLSDDELSRYPVHQDEMRKSYGAVAQRIGISGRVDDDLSDYFGLDEWAQPPIEMGQMQAWLLGRYAKVRAPLVSRGFRLGRSRVAALSEVLGGRAACDRRGNCLWGCTRGSLYSAADELATLSRYSNFRIEHACVATSLTSNETGCHLVVRSRLNGKERILRSSRLVLAAGTLASTRLVLDALKISEPVRLYSCPTAAFLLWVPSFLGRQPEQEFGLGQLSFALDLREGMQGFGSLFSTAAISVTEFASYVPLARPHAIQMLKGLLGSCLAGNVFLPSELSNASVQLNANGDLIVRGAHSADVQDWASRAQSVLWSAFLRMGALVLPASFALGKPGSDMHYIGTMPMSSIPARGFTAPDGGVYGMRNVYVADGACLPPFPAKSHTLTIMANADRIGRKMASTDNK